MKKNIFYLKKLKLFPVFFFVLFSIFSFGEVPHTYIYENPEKEVTQTETLKRHKEKAELNISVTKLKSEPIKMKHNVDEKKIYFDLDAMELKRNNNSLNLETTDRIFVSEKLEEVPSITTTNGRRKINGLKKLNKSLDNGTIKGGNLTWTVKDLRTADVKKNISIEYKTFPKELYVGITDKDYKLKKVFVGKMSDLELLIDIHSMDSYTSFYHEDTQISNQYDNDISDILMWDKDKRYVDIKFSEAYLEPVPSNSTLYNRRLYFAVEDSNVTLTGTKGQKINGTLHIVDRSVQPFSLLNTILSTTSKTLLNKVFANKNLENTATVRMNLAYYIRVNTEDFKNLQADTYTADKGIYYGHTDFSGNNEAKSKIFDLPTLKLTNDIIAQPKKIEIDFWVFGTDFTDKVNYLLDPRLNGSGNLKIRALDEEAPLDNSVNAGETDSVFDIKGRLAKFDFDDTTKIEVQNISGFTPTQQNQGSFFSHKNKWVEGTIPGYKVRTRIWSDFDGIEIDFEKTSNLNISNDGVRKFKIIHTHTGTGRVIQEIIVNLYVNNIKIQDRSGYFNTKRSDISLKRAEGTVPNFSAYFTEKDKLGRPAKTGNTVEKFGSYNNAGPFMIQMITKPGDLKEYFPIMTSKGIYMKTSDNPLVGTHTVKLSATQLQISHDELIGTLNGDWYIASTASNGLSTLKVVHRYQKPISLVKKVGGIWLHWYDLVSNPEDGGKTPYITYGNEKRKLETIFRIRVIDWENSPPLIRKLTTTIRGVPLLGNISTGENQFFKGIVWDSFNENSKSVTDNDGWITTSFGKSMFGQARYTIGGSFNSSTNTVIGGQTLINVWIGNNSPNYSQVENFSYQSNDLIFNRRRDIKQPYLGIGVALKKWTMSKQKQIFGPIHQEGGATPVNIGKAEYERDELYFEIEPFDAKFLYDRGHSSIKEGILKNIDMDFSPNVTPKGQTIKIGEVYFRHLNVKALRQNTNQKPRFVLPDTAYLTYKDGSQPNIKIPVKLSFSDTDTSILSFEMKDKTGNYAGENGMTVYLHIDDASAKQLYNNGENKRYQVKGTYSNHGWGVLAQSDTEEVIKIGVVATTTPNGGTRNEPFSNWITNNMVFETSQFKPNAFSINFQGNQPLITNDFYVLGNTVTFVNPPNEYNYNSSVTITGNVDPYQYEIKQHRYQLTDDTGKLINGEISSGGSGAYWDNLLVGTNRITLYHTREGQANREATFIKIDDWNYEKSSGKITKKHYKPYSTSVNQYFDITVNFPELDPYIYYNPASTVKLKEKITLQRNKSETLPGNQNIYVLGTIKTQNYNVDITKKSSGTLTDTQGLRIIPNQNVIFTEKGTNNTHTTKGKFLFLDSNGKEISIDNMIGANKSVTLALQIPSDLPQGKDYIVKGGNIDTILDKGNNIPNQPYNLIIGRNKYFKEIIPEIEIKKGKLVGAFTIILNNEYLPREMIKFNSTTLSERAPLKLEPPVPSGVNLDYREGETFLQLEKGDKFEVRIGEEVTTTTVTFDIPESLTTEKKEILLEDGISKAAIKIVDGKVQLGLNYWKPNAYTYMYFRALRNGEELMNQTLKFVGPESQIAVTQKEDLDFGNVIQGAKNVYSEAEIHILNYGPLADFTFQLSDTSPILENQRESKLKVREINGGLFKKDERNYLIKLNGYLDVPKEADTGQYAGAITIKLYLK